MWEQEKDAYHSMRWDVKTGESWVLGDGKSDQQRQAKLENR